MQWEVLLFDAMIETYKLLYPTRRVSQGLKFRLNNIGARNLSYYKFMDYFNLQDNFETLNFILDDKNMEEIMRYSTTFPDRFVDNSFLNRVINHKK